MIKKGINLNIFKDLYEKYIVKKNLKNIFIIGIAGIVLISLSGIFSSDKPKSNVIKSAETKNIDLIKKNSQKEIEEMLCDINGVKKAKVLITYEDNGSYEYLYDEKYNLEEKKKEDQDKKVSKKREDGNEIPILVRELAPRVKGVTVIVDGSFNEETSLRIYNAVKCALGVETHKIEVVTNNYEK